MTNNCGFNTDHNKHDRHFAHNHAAPVSIFQTDLDTLKDENFLCFHCVQRSGICLRKIIMFDIL